MLEAKNSQYYLLVTLKSISIDMIDFTYSRIEEPITETLVSRTTKARTLCFNVCRK